MKPELLIIASLLYTAIVSAQGTIVFDNQATGVKAYVYGFDPTGPTYVKTGQNAAGTPPGSVVYNGPPLAGTGFTATLWARNAATVAGVDDPIDVNGNNLVQVGGPVGFRPPGIFAGRVAPSTANPVVEDVTDASQRATFQLRVWDNRDGAITTWDQAVEAWRAGNTGLGWSPLFTVQSALGGFGQPPSTPPNLVGLQSFELIYPLPEPSTIGLGLIGAGCLLLLRHRK